MTIEGQPWRLEVVLPHVGLDDERAELFAWLRDWVIPTILHAPHAYGPPEFHFLPPDGPPVDPSSS